MRTKPSLALWAVLAAFLFAGTATAAPGHGSTIHQLIAEAGAQGDLLTNVKFAFSKKKKSKKFAFPKKKKSKKFAFPKKKKPGKLVFSKKKTPGKYGFSKKKTPGKYAFSKKKKSGVYALPPIKKAGNGGNSQPTPPTYEELLEAAGYDSSGDNGGNGGNAQPTLPTYEELLEAAGYDGSGTPPTYEELLEAAGYDSTLVGDGGNGGDNSGNGGSGGNPQVVVDCGDGNGNFAPCPTDHGGHGHGFPGLHLGIGFGYNVTGAAPAVPSAAHPTACGTLTATPPRLLDQVAARLALLNELNRQGVLEDDQYRIQKAVVLLNLAEVVGVADALQVIKCIEEQDLIGDNE